MDWTTLLTAISAIGAAGAAGAAAWQAFEVRKQLAESRNQGEIARAQFLQARYDEARPVLIVISSPQAIAVQQGNECYLDWNQQPPVIEVCNVGNGPALNVRSVIYGPEAEAFAGTGSSPLSEGFIWQYLSDEKQKEAREKHWYYWATDAVSRGESRKLQYDLAGRFSPIKFSEKNKFLESKNHERKCTLNAPKQPLSSPNSGEPWYMCRVTITYQDIFHRKHATLCDLAFQQRWQVVALIDDIKNDLGDLAE